MNIRYGLNREIYSIAICVFALAEIELQQIKKSDISEKLKKSF